MQSLLITTIFVLLQVFSLAATPSSGFTNLNAPHLSSSSSTRVLCLLNSRPTCCSFAEGACLHNSFSKGAYSSLSLRSPRELLWGFYAHQLINRLAVFTLPPEMLPFYKTHIQYITENAVNPDCRRYAVEGEAERHLYRY